MKTFVTLFISLFAVSAMSCPTINSSFQCEKNPEDATDSGVITIESVKNGAEFFYKFVDNDDPESESLFPTDGKVYPTGNGTYKGSCSGNVFSIQVTGQEENVGPYVLDMTYTLDAQKNLVNEGTIKYKVEGKEEVLPFASTCTKL